MTSEDEARAALAQRRQEAREADARETRERYGAMAASARVSTPPRLHDLDDVIAEFGIDLDAPSTPPSDEDDVLVKKFADGLFHAGVRSPDSTRAVLILREVLAGFRRQAVPTPEPGWEYGIRIIGTSKWAPTTAEHVAKVQAWHNGTYEFARRTAPGDWQPLPTEGEA